MTSIIPFFFFFFKWKQIAVVGGRIWKCRRIPFVSFDQGKKSLGFDSGNMNLTKMNKGRNHRGRD